MEITKKLFELQDREYGEFHGKLIPSVEKERIIGVRIPEARKLAKQYAKEAEAEKFLKQLPHTYYDEDIIHCLLISEMKDYDRCLEEIDVFLPHVDNWAVCDIMSPKVFKKNKYDLIERIRKWSRSPETYICRFGLKMLMSHFLDDGFRKEYLEIPAEVHSEEYYVRMMVAWFFATALAKQWDDTIGYLENNSLDRWVHNKTIQKARESNRITGEQKEYLKSLKRV